MLPHRDYEPARKRLIWLKARREQLQIEKEIGLTSSQSKSVRSQWMIGVWGIIGVIIVLVFLIVGQQFNFFPFIASVPTLIPTNTTIPSDTPQPLPTATFTRTPNPTSTITPSPSPTPQRIPFDNLGVEILVYDNPPERLESDEGMVRIVLTAGDNPISDVKFLILLAAQDFAGAWNIVGGSGQIFDPDINGVLEQTLSPGDYVLYRESGSLGGLWGIPILRDSRFAGQAVVFPIIAGKLTLVRISLAQLELGVTYRNGVVFRNGAYAALYCQGIDIVGNKIIDEENCSLGGRSYAGIDGIGISTNNLGVGTYMIIITEPFPGNGERIVHDIELLPGETRRLIIDVPWDSP